MLEKSLENVNELAVILSRQQRLAIHLEHSQGKLKQNFWTFEKEPGDDAVMQRQGSLPLG